jgi:hypothetical protein
MIRVFYGSVSRDGYITFYPTKIENRVIKGTYYIERDFKKLFPTCDSFHLSINEFDNINLDFKNLDLKQFKVSMV